MIYQFINKHLRKVTAVIIFLLFTASMWQLAAAGWIQGKAIIAQQLLDRAWTQTVNNSREDGRKQKAAQGQRHKPWPWADTWPVARLVVPDHDINQIVLAGDSGSSLAFGPGHAFASAAPNTQGLSMISGHRDTHFHFLKYLSINDTILLQTTGKKVAYRVYDLQVVDSMSFTVTADWTEQTLLLVTCYPFDAITAGGPLRYLVYAKQESVIKTKI